MDFEQIKKSIKEITSRYEMELQNFDESDFFKNPSESEWSLSEVYFHIFDASILTTYTIMKLEAGEGVLGEPNALGCQILANGGLPEEIKLKAPAFFIERLKKLNQSDTQELIEKFKAKLKLVENTIPLIDSALSSEHPKLGYFNALQWFQFMEMHLRHHLNQVYRVKSKL